MHTFQKCFGVDNYGKQLGVPEKYFFFVYSVNVEKLAPRPIVRDKLPTTQGNSHNFFTPTIHMRRSIKSYMFRCDFSFAPLTGQNLFDSFCVSSSVPEQHFNILMTPFKLSR